VTKVLKEVLAANARYVDDFGDRSELPMPPGRRFAILTCMDARLDPAKFAGLAEGDAHVIRNAGGRASDDAIRSLVISYKLLGTREWFVIHHTDCGMETFTDEIMRDLLASSLETATIDERGWRDTGKGPGSSEGATSTGSPSTSTPRAWSRTWRASTTTRWSTNPYPSTATSTM
jgi:carbonic anhydrase